VVHSLAVLKGHPECLKCGKPFGGQGSAPDPGGAYSAPPDPLAGGEGAGCPPPIIPLPLSALRAFNLGPRTSLLASPNPFAKIRLCSELNLKYFNPSLL